MTSSSAAIMYKELEPGRDTLDERDWTNLSDPRAMPYVKSKTLAERAAWEYVENNAPEIELTTINPCLSGYHPHPLYVVCLLGLQARAGAGALRRRSG